MKLDSVEAFTEFSLNKASVDLVFLSFDDLEGLGELFTNGEVSATSASLGIVEASVDLLQGAALGLSTDALVGRGEKLSLGNREVEGQISLGSQEVVPDALLKECGRLLLDLVKVGEL